MSYYIDKNGTYYEGDKANWQDREVPQRPDSSHMWNGSAWVLAPSLVPNVVTMRQARLALMQSGYLAPVNAAIADMQGAGGDAARITWEFAGEVRRNDALLAQLAGALGLSDAVLDELFQLAGSL